MLKKITQLLLPFLLVVTASVYGASPSFEGGTGLPYMRTADTVGDGELDLHFRTGLDKYERGTVSDSLVSSSLGLTYGLTKEWELGADMPFVANDGDGASGIPYLKIYSKLRLSGGRDKGHSFGVSVYGTGLASDVTNEIGSGENGYGVEINFSLYDEYFGKLAEGLSVHLTLGREKADFKNLGTPLTYTSETFNRYNVGLEYKPSNTYSLTLEAIGSTITDNNDDNLLIVPGISYSPTDQVTWHLGAGIGVPDDRSQPRYRVFAGVAYRFNKRAPDWQQPIVEETEAAPEPEPVRQAPPPAESEPLVLPFSIETDVHELPPEKAEKPKPKPAVRQPAPVRQEAAPAPVQKRPAVKAKPRPQPKPVAKPKPQPRPVARPRPQPRPVVRPRPQPKPVVKPKSRLAPPPGRVGKPRIEIWNASGEAGLAVKVATRLRRKGFLVTKVGGVKYYRKSTTIYYGPNFEKQAKRVARALWEEGDIESTYSLHNKIDIQIIIGTDMKTVWKIWNTR